MVVVSVKKHKTHLEITYICYSKKEKRSHVYPLFFHSHLFMKHLTSVMLILPTLSIHLATTASNQSYNLKNVHTFASEKLDVCTERKRKP